MTTTEIVVYSYVDNNGVTYFTTKKFHSPCDWDVVEYTDCVQFVQRTRNGYKWTKVPDVNTALVLLVETRSSL